MSIHLKRVYEKASSGDGYRVLVDRLWPRGVSRDAAQLDEWLKQVAPSDGLREAFHRHEAGWGEFRRQYLSELKTHRDELRALARLARHKPVTLLFSASDPAHNNAVVLRQYLNMLDAG